VHQLVLASSSTVYGESDSFPTREDHTPLQPISAYGRSKLRSEKILQQTLPRSDVSIFILRFANVVGGRSRRGVVHDLVSSLKKDVKTLTVLGSGNQLKSFVHVKDAVSAILCFPAGKGRGKAIYNVGSSDWISISTVARIILSEMHTVETTIRFQPGPMGDGGWAGDVTKSWLDISKMRGLGWIPELNSQDAVRMATQEYLRYQP
jgi:UDP-glucose 4-epimerase